MRPGKRWLALLMVAMLGLQTLSLSEALSVRAARSSSSFVHWSVDDGAQTITVTVDLSFFCSSCGDELAGIVQNIVAKIHQDWDGHYYKCYQLKVQINTHIASGASDVPDTSMPIEVTGDLGSTVRAQTAMVGSTNYLSTDPSDALQPDNNQPVSYWPPEDEAADYAHEFGHMLGLDDNYDPSQEGQPILRDGATGDVMFKANPSLKNFVSEDMINRAVERSGQVDTSKIHCNLTMDAGPSSFITGIANLKDMKLHAWTCDYQVQTNDPKHPPKPMHWQGTLSYTGEIPLAVLFGKAPSGNVSLSASGDVLISPKGAGSELTMNAIPGDPLTANFRWSDDGTIVASEAFKLGGLTTQIFSPGPPLFATVTKGAKECSQ